MTFEHWAQLVGLVATLIIASSYQAKTKKGLLSVQSPGIVILCVHYLMLGASSGFALNVVCLTRNACFFFEKEKTKLYYVTTGVLMCAMVVVGLFSWQGPISLLLLLALAANTFFISLGNQQILRYSILVTSSMVLIYNIAVCSIGGILTETISIFSAAVGIVRFLRASKTKADAV